MIRERVLTISALLAFVVLSGAAYAAPKNTDQSYRQTEPDRYRAFAMRPGAPPAQIAPEGYSAQQRCRYLGGPKNSIPQC
jgi:hypothetical protein